MTDQIIERLALFMGYDVIDTDHLQALYRGDKRQITYFAPLTNWNHWRQVEERLMEDGKSQLMKDYMKYYDGKFHYMGTDLPERCKALVSVLQGEDE